MVDLGEALRTRLLDAAAVTALVVDRITWTKRAQGDALPALVLTQVGGGPEELDLDDAADSVERRVQCSALAESHAVACALADAATLALVGDAEVSGFLFWEGSREEPVDLGGDTEQGFVHEVVRDIVLRVSRIG